MNHHPDLVGALLPGQFASAAQHPLPRRVLGRGTVALLIALRVYVLVAVPIVAYAFIQALHAPRH